MDDRGILDIEWDENSPDKALLLIGWRDRAYTEAEAHEAGVFLEMADPSITKVSFSNSDHRWLWEHGFEVDGPFHDIQVAAWVYDERTDLDLDSVSHMYGSVGKDVRLVRRSSKVLFRCDDGTLVPIGDAPLDQLRRYNERDLLAEESAYLDLLDRLKRTGRLEHFLAQVPYSDVLLRMTLAGLPLDVLKTKVASRELRIDVESRQSRLLNSGQLPDGFNLASRTQLALYLFTDEFEWPTRFKLAKEAIAAAKRGEWPDELPLDFEPTKVGREYITGVRRLKGRGLTFRTKAPKCQKRDYPGEGCDHVDEGDCEPSVSTKVLRVEQGDDPWVAEFCDWKVLVKGLQFLVTWLEEVKDGRIHAQFKQTGTDTGRLSSSDPNLQQVPSRGDLGQRFRKLFRPPAGRVFLHADFAQMEPRIGASFSQDPFLLNVFDNDLDLYEELTAQVLGDRYPKGTPERQLVRQTYLAMSYGGKAQKIRTMLAIEGFRFQLRKVEKVRNDVIDLCAGFWQWKNEACEEAEERGYIETIGGHRRHIGWLDPDMRWKSENQTVASIISGSAADITQGTMMVISQEIPVVQLVVSVHDELMAELDKTWAKEYVRAAFQAAGETGHGYVLDGVNLKFDARYIGNWAEAK